MAEGGVSGPKRQGAARVPRIARDACRVVAPGFPKGTET